MKLLRDTIQFLIRQGGELFFYHFAESRFGLDAQLLLAHLDSASVWSGGQKRPVEITVAHNLLVVMCWSGTAILMASFPDESVCTKASAMMLSAKVVLFADKRGERDFEMLFSPPRTLLTSATKGTGTFRASICPQKRSVLHLPTQRAPLAIAARCIGHRTALKQFPLLAASAFVFD